MARNTAIPTNAVMIPIGTITPGRMVVLATDAIAIRAAPVNVIAGSGEPVEHDEVAKLKRLPAEAMLDNVALKDLLGKKW